MNNDNDIFENLEDSGRQAIELLSNIYSEKQMFQYAEGKWTIKEIVQHLIDTERVFNYRALRISRKDSIDLAGFDEKYFVTNPNANERVYNDLVEEFSIIRKSTILLYQSFSENTLLEKGKVSGNIMSVRVLSFIASGHVLHHLNVINHRYL